jgi:hypothetical protein
MELHMFRISKDLNTVEDIESEDEIESTVRALGPSRYHIDEIVLDPFPSGHCSRAWGVGIHQPDGRIALKPFFYGDHVAVEPFPD